MDIKEETEQFIIGSETESLVNDIRFILSASEPFEVTDESQSTVLNNNETQFVPLDYEVVEIMKQHYKKAPSSKWNI